MSNESAIKYLDQYIERKKINHIRKAENQFERNSAKQIEADIETVMRDSQKLYWSLLESKEKNLVSTDYSNVLTVAQQYLKESELTLNENDYKTPSLNIVEFGQTDSHIHTMGGDVSLKNVDVKAEVINTYLELPYVDTVISYTVGLEDYYMIVVSNDMDNLGYQLTSVQVDIFDKYPEYDFELRYSVKGCYDESIIPDYAKTYSRG